VREFADQLRADGHIAHTPDLFDGEQAATIKDGIALTDRIGDQVLTERADRAVADLPKELVYGGFSFGAATAQRLAQTRPGARGALLYLTWLTIMEFRRALGCDLRVLGFLCSDLRTSRGF
jgi:dienelactone hydrolase